MKTLTAKESSTAGLTKGKKYDVISKRIDKDNDDNLLCKIKNDFGDNEEWGHIWFVEYQPKENSSVNHPLHYGGKDNPYEAIKVIEHYKLGFCLGNKLKYILRAGKKDSSKYVEDLEKAKWYLERKINNLKQEQK